MPPFFRSIPILFLFACVAPVCAQEKNPLDVPDEIELKIQEGLFHLYNLDFDQAEQAFAGIRQHSQEHPIIAFGEASVHWWRLSVYVLETDPEESKAFLDTAERCIQLSKEKIDQEDSTAEGYLTLGGAYGLMGRWLATNQKYVNAYFTGKKAVKYLRKAIKMNPGLYDANMGLGIFDYYVATLPTYIRTLAFIGGNTNRQVGLDELQSAVDKGIYAQTPSKLFLQELYANFENNPEKSNAILNDLKLQYPKSPFINILVVISLYNQGKVAELEQEADAYLAQVSDKTYRPEFAVNAWFAQGIARFKVRKWEEAITCFNTAIASGTVKSPFFTWSTLYKGYALDALGKRAEAETQYKEVLNQLRRWGSRDEAEKRLSKPFEGTDQDLAKLKL